MNSQSALCRLWQLDCFWNWDTTLPLLSSFGFCQVMAYHNVISCHTTMSSCHIMICSNFVPSSSIPTSTSMAPSCPCVPISIYLFSVVRSIFFPFCLSSANITISLPELSKADDSQNLPRFCQICSIQSSISQYMSSWISSYYIVISPWWKPLNFPDFFFLLLPVNSTLLSSVLWEFSVIISPYSALLAIRSCTA